MDVRVLMTGFEPFDGEPINAAWEVVRTFADQRLPGLDVVVRQLPTVFGKSLAVLQQALEETQPDWVVCVGQAGGRSALSFERIGVNLIDARIPDNAGVSVQDAPIVPDGPTAYWSTLPVRKLVETLREAGIPAELSMTAGTYVCNHVLYGLMHFLQQDPYRARNVRGGFIHVPFLPEQAVRHRNAPSLSAETVTRGLTLALTTLRDVSRTAMGAVAAT
ncbi:MAG: pyroglutamyl-peptidase I [Alicyclobacillus sp.]|nr:pyroglutamyl-peptidase I [Alicyclobacillus sp.]